MFESPPAQIEHRSTASEDADLSSLGAGLHSGGFGVSNPMHKGEAVMSCLTPALPVSSLAYERSVSFWIVR